MAHHPRPLIVGLGGAARENSSSEKALKVALAAAAAQGMDTVLISGAALDLPLYAPHQTARAERAVHMIDVLRRCDGLILSSPSYHGSISGLVKNALDYTEDMGRDERIYFDGCPVGLIGCGAGWQGAHQVLTAMRGIVHALRGWPTPLGAVLNTAQPLFNESGHCVDEAARFQLETVGQQVAQFVHMKLRAAQPVAA